MRDAQVSDETGQRAPLMLHSAWRGIVASYVSATVFAALAIWAFAVGGVRVISVVLGFIAIVLAAIAVFDYPIALRVTPAGLQRRCLGRRATLAWDRVQTITRTADVASSSSSAVGGGRVRRGRAPGGLVAVSGRRRYLLTNHSESRDEHAAVRAAVQEWAPDVRFVAQLPLEDQPPTWLYRHGRHRPPQSSGGR